MPPRQLLSCILKNNLPIAVVLESSAITPRYAVDADDLPLSVVVTLTAAHFGSLRSQPGPGTSSLLTKPQLFTQGR